LDQSDREEIRINLCRVLALGRAVRAIVRGSVIKVHLATIDRFLEVRTGNFWPIAHEVDNDTDADAEFRLLKPYSTVGHGKPLQPWESFHDWLRLMVHHFDAIHVLDNHIDNLGSSIDISIKIYYASFPDKEMLPWKTLLENEKYFPLIPYTPDQPSAAELITFLTSPTLDEDRITVEDLINNVSELKDRQKTGFGNFTTDIQTLTEGLDDFKESAESLSDGWKDYVVDLLRKVETLKSDSTTLDRLSRLEDISNMLENLKASFKLFKEVGPKTHLSRGSFSGSVHCEIYAALTSYLSGTPGPHDGFSEGLLAEFAVSHISVSSSNLCQTLQYRNMETSSECLNDAAQCVLACSAY